MCFVQVSKRSWERGKGKTDQTPNYPRPGLCMISKESRATMISPTKSAVKETKKKNHTGRVVSVRMEVEHGHLNEDA